MVFLLVSSIFFSPPSFPHHHRVYSFHLSAFYTYPFFFTLAPPVFPRLLARLFAGTSLFLSYFFLCFTPSSLLLSLFFAGSSSHSLSNILHCCTFSVLVPFLPSVVVRSLKPTSFLRLPLLSSFRLPLPWLFFFSFFLVSFFLCLTHPLVVSFFFYPLACVIHSSSVSFEPGSNPFFFSPFPSFCLLSLSVSFLVLCLVFFSCLPVSFFFPVFLISMNQYLVWRFLVFKTCLPYFYESIPGLEVPGIQNLSSLFLWINTWFSAVILISMNQYLVWRFLVFKTCIPYFYESIPLLSWFLWILLFSFILSVFYLEFYYLFLWIKPSVILISMNQYLVWRFLVFKTWFSSVVGW